MSDSGNQFIGWLGGLAASWQASWRCQTGEGVVALPADGGSVDRRICVHVTQQRHGRVVDDDQRLIGAGDDAVGRTERHDRRVCTPQTDNRLTQQPYTTTHNHGRGGGKLNSCPGPPQLRGLHRKTVKNNYLKKHKNTFWSVNSIGTCIRYTRFMMSRYSFNSLYNVYFYTFLKVRILDVEIYKFILRIQIYTIYKV